MRLLRMPNLVLCSASHCSFFLCVSLHGPALLKGPQFFGLGKSMLNVFIVHTVVADGTVEYMFVAEFINH